MELQQYQLSLRRYWRCAVGSVLAGTAFAAGATLLPSPDETTTSLVLLSGESGGCSGERLQGATYAERQVPLYVDVTSGLVLQSIIDGLVIGVTPPLSDERLSVSSRASTQSSDSQSQAGDRVRKLRPGPALLPPASWGGGHARSPWAGRDAVNECHDYPRPCVTVGTSTGRKSLPSCASRLPPIPPTDPSRPWGGRLRVPTRIDCHRPWAQV